MFRTLVIGVSVALFLGLGLWGSSLRSNDALESAEALAERELSLAAELLPALYRFDAETVRAKAIELAHSPALIAQLGSTVKSPLSYVQRHEAVDETLKRLKDEERKGADAQPSLQAPLGDWAKGHPYFILAVDEGGVCVAHTNNPRCYSEDETGSEYTRMLALFPSLTPLASEGDASAQSMIDIWVIDHKPMLIGASVVRKDTQMKRGKGPREERVGLVVVGYPLSALAGFYKARLNLDVAFVREGSLIGASSLDGALEAHLQELFERQAKGPRSGEQEGPELLKTRSGALGALPSSSGLSFMVALDWSARLKGLTSSGELLIFALLAGLLVLIVVSVSYTRFIEPFKQIDLGLIEVQNGNHDYWFSYNIQDNGLSKTIAQNLDVIVSRYLGRPEPEFEDEP